MRENWENYKRLQIFAKASMNRENVAYFQSLNDISQKAMWKGLKDFINFKRECQKYHLL